MKKTFPSFDLGIDHLFPSEPEERKQKKEEQQRFACLDVSKLDDLVEGAQAKATKYVTKYAVTFFRVIFAFNYYNKIPKIIFCFFLMYYMLQTADVSIQILHCRCFKCSKNDR